jgi:hypothetical protein
MKNENDNDEREKHRKESTIRRRMLKLKDASIRLKNRKNHQTRSRNGIKRLNVKRDVE